MEGVFFLFVFAKPWDKGLCNYSPDNINKEQRQQLFPQPLDIKPNKSNIEQISKSNNKLIYKIFQYNTILITFPTFMSLYFC